MSDDFVDENRVPRGRGSLTFPLYWLVWIVWLPFLAPGILQILRSPSKSSLQLLTLLCLALFTALYLAATYLAARDLYSLAPGYRVAGSKAKWPVGAAMAALSVIIATLNRESVSLDMSPFIYTAAYVAGTFGLPRAAFANAAVLLIFLATGLILKMKPAETAQAVFLICVVGFMTITWVHSITTNRKLEMARHEVSRLAVTNERLRIARDLHDLLGHTLTLIRLKSELAGRLLRSDPERAGGEIEDIGREAGSALQKVREALSRYRSMSLEGELRAAREILAASGIACRVDWDPVAIGTLPAKHEEALAFAVREGVTNVVRHSSARSCTLRLSKNDAMIRVEILDDGRAEGPAVKEGSGIRGLRDRVAALGGRCEAGYVSPQGFILTVTLAPPARGAVESPPNS